MYYYTKLVHYRLSDFFFTCDAIYVSKMSTIVQKITALEIPAQVRTDAQALYNVYQDIETVKRSSVKQYVSLKGKVIKVTSTSSIFLPCHNPHLPNFLIQTIFLLSIQTSLYQN